MPKKTTTSFGERLDAAIVHSKKTRAELAAKLGVSVQAIGQVVNGDSKTMSAENTVRAARALEVDAYWLATGEGSMSPPQPPLGVMETPATYVVAEGQTEKLLIEFGALLGGIPAERRQAAADALAGWARDGGADHWRQMFQALVSMESSSKRQARAA
jgi:transcriptional regulator with XRE-family HTH domain